MPPFVNLIVPKVTCTQYQRITIRYSFVYHYINVLDTPIEKYWGGNIGTISLIRKILKMPRHSRRKIRQTLEEGIRYAQEAEKVQCIIKPINKVGQHIIILPGSSEETLIAKLYGSTMWLPYDNAASEQSS